MSTNVSLAYFTLLVIAIVGVLIYLAVRSGKGYSVEDTRAHAEKYGGIVEEGHGGLTAFCWVTIGGIVIWSIIYLIIHWDQFAIVFFR